MLNEGILVRVIATGEVGEVVGWEPGGSRCLVRVLPVFLNGGEPDARELKIDDLEALTEADTASRKRVCDGVELAVFDTTCFSNLNGWMSLAFRFLDDGVLVRASDMLDGKGCEMFLQGDDARCLRSAFMEMKSYAWTEEFAPPWPVLDGYGWRLSVYSGSAWYSCSGSNAEPEELVSFFDCLAGLGLPVSWREGDCPVLLPSNGKE